MEKAICKTTVIKELLSEKLEAAQIFKKGREDGKINYGISLEAIFYNHLIHGYEAYEGTQKIFVIKYWVKKSGKIFAHM